jgi:hypothetical protein
MLNVIIRFITQSVALSYCYDEYRYAECGHTGCNYAECRYKRKMVYTIGH